MRIEEEGGLFEDSKKLQLSSAATVVSPRQAFFDILKIALPMGASYTFSFSVVTIGILIGNFESEQNKTDQLGGSTLITTMLNTLGLLAIGLIFSVSIFTGKKRGQLKKVVEENQPESEEAAAIVGEISTLVKNSIMMGGIVLPLPTLIMYFSKDFLILCGQSADVAEIAQSYLRPSIGVLIFLMVRMCFEQIMFGFKKQTPAMAIGLINYGLGVFLATSMCFGKFNFPRWGLPGIAYGFTIESALTCLGFGLYMNFHRDFKGFRFFGDLKFNAKDWQQIKNLVRIGGPIAFTILNEVFANMMVGLYAGWLGSTQLAAQNYGSLFIFFVLIPLFSFGQATCQQVSREIGEERYDNASRYARYGLLSSLTIMAPLCLLVSLSPELLVKNLTNTDGVDEAVISQAKTVMPITALGMFFDTARYNMLQVLRATDDHAVPTAISIITLWLGVGAAGVFGFGLSLGLDGVATGFSLGMAAGSLGLLLRWYNKLQPEALASAAVVRTRLSEDNDAKEFSWIRSLSICCGKGKNGGKERLLEEVKPLTAFV